MKKVLIMELKPGDVQTTAPIPLTVKANEPLRKNAHIKYQGQGYLCNYAYTACCSQQWSDTLSEAGR